MATALQLINGIPRMVTLATGATDVTYDQATVVPGGGYPFGTLVTLPLSETYSNLELKVFWNGQFLEPIVDYSYVGGAPRTQIQIERTDITEGDSLRFQKIGDPLSIYDQTIVVPNGGYPPSQTITLPLAQTYDDVELQVFLDGQLLQEGEDYVYLGAIPRTQIQLIPELFENERLRIRIDL